MDIINIEQSDPRYQQERDLRNRVLLRPIGIPDFGWEARDEESVHFVALEEQQVIGCVLLWPGPDGTGQLLQMAVEASCQGRGVGREMVEVLLTRAGEMGLTKVWCHARAEVIPFYANSGFKEVGPRFQEVNIEHQRMERAL